MFCHCFVTSRSTWQVTDELDTLGHTADTLVVLHSDHGWSLGEHGEWQKFSNFEHGVRVPLIIRAPWLAQSAGTRSRALAELIDVLPTMAGLIGVPLPAGEVFDGKSLAPLLSNPTSVALADSIKPFAMSQYMRCPRNASVLWKNNYCLFTDRVNLPYMGYTIRTRKHRYTEWIKWYGSALRPDHTTPRGAGRGGAVQPRRRRGRIQLRRVRERKRGHGQSGRGGHDAGASPRRHRQPNPNQIVQPCAGLRRRSECCPGCTLASAW